MKTLTVGSCFSGIGGLELGLERTGGFETKWQIENDPYASAVLAKHWPNAERYGDIRTLDPSRLERVDLICGGYPCQPFSLAGQRGGESDDRHLWPAMLAVIRALRPRWCLLENVPGHLSLGFGRVLGDLAELGYDAEWRLLSAAGVGAPHLRRRVFILAHASINARRVGDRNGSDDVAYTEGSRGKQSKNETDAGAIGRKRRDGSLGGRKNVADPLGLRREKGGKFLTGESNATRGRQMAHAKCQRPQVGRSAADEPITKREVARREGLVADAADERNVRRDRELRADERAGSRRRDLRHRAAADDGREWWSTEPDVGRVAYGIPSRVDRLRCLGNAVVPACAEKVGRMILEYENSQP